MAIIRRNKKSKLHIKWRKPAYKLVSQILGYNPELFNNFLLAANREYAILNNNKHFRGFAVVRNKNGEVVVDLIGANTRPHKRPPAGQKGWGTQLMQAIRKNAGKRPVRIHDPVALARGFYTRLGAQSASNTTYGTRTMRLRASPASPQSRLRTIPENKSPRRKSPRSPSVRRSPSKK
jgi:hypothetical protein